jgi:hypothetical protein
MPAGEPSGTESERQCMSHRNQASGLDPGLFIFFKNTSKFLTKNIEINNPASYTISL